jgi:vacuolar-type H+-ATPase subunit F/Vma7
VRIAAVGDPVTVQALKLMGISGAAVTTADEAAAALDEYAVPDAIVLVTGSVAKLIRAKVDKMKIARQSFIVVEIPSVEGVPQQADEIARAVSQTIGIKV